MIASARTRVCCSLPPPAATFSVMIESFTRLSSVAWFSSGSDPVPAQPIVELREYDLHPEHAVAYLQATAKAADLRKSLVPLRFFSLPEMGGQLHVATHAYYYAGGYEERNTRRGVMAQSSGWKEYLKECRPHMQCQRSNIFVEAPLVHDLEAIAGLVAVPEVQSGSDSILELRRYQLKLGYDTVPKFLSLYGAGLPAKLQAEGTDPTTSLVTLLYSEVGRLNEVIEVWRHGNGTAAMERSRVAARSAAEWRQAIADIADLAIEFKSTIHRPVAFSPLK